MEEQLFDLLKKLISIPSVKDNPQELEKTLDFTLDLLPSFAFEQFESNGIKSILVYNLDKRPKKFKVLLNAHLDVVPAKDEMFIPKDENGKIYGRGAYDMKSGAIAEILAFKELAGKVDYPLALQIVIDEEVGGFNGTKYQLESGVLADFVISGEPTDLRICYKQKGVLWVQITQKGKNAHGSRPWDGVSSNIEMCKNINRFFEENPSLTQPEWKTSYNLSMLHGGTARNVIPDETVATLDIRRIDTEDTQDIINNLKKYFPVAQVEAIFDEPCLNTSPDNEFVKLLKESARKELGKDPELFKEHFGSDARFYSANGVPTVNFGPKGDGLHSDVEWVDKNSLIEYYGVLKRFLLEV
jgi:succinyl-diaminopimelate desuccinylase